MVLALVFKLNSCWSGRERSSVSGVARKTSVLFYFVHLPCSSQNGLFFFFFLGGGAMVCVENKGIKSGCLDTLKVFM